MKMHLTCKKLVMIRSGHEGWMVDEGPKITAMGWSQLMSAAKKLITLLKTNTPLVFVRDEGGCEIEFAHELGALLDASVIEKAWPKLINAALRNQDGYSLNRLATHLKAEVLIQVTNATGLRQFHHDFTRLGLRNLSSKIKALSADNASYIFGNGSFWCADLEKHTLFCGRASCNPGEVTTIYPGITS